MKTILINSLKTIFLLAVLVIAGEKTKSQTTAYSNIALNKTATASSLETSGLTAASAFDGDQNTRFSSGYDDNAWLSVDLGKASLIKNISIVWERAYGTDFNILFSNNGTFTDLYVDSIHIRNNTLSGNSIAGTNNITMKTNTIARYVRMQGVRRATGYGYSIYEMQVTGTQNFSASSTLPVTLTNFTVAKQNNAALITWTTLVESNNQGFSIERSADGNGFNEIGWVAGQNKGSVVLNYAFTDNQPLQGKSYYRIKQVDFDGRASYTTVIVINNDIAANVKAYPVPVTDHLTVEYKSTKSEKITIAIFNAAGQTVTTTV